MTEISIKVECEGVCEGCLSQDRRLRPLGTLRELFNRIILQDHKNYIHTSQSERRLCWECISYLRNAHKFQQRVHNAQMLLQLTCKGTSVKHSVMGISTLVQTFKDSFDYNLIYNENDVKVFNDFVKTENDKQDIVDLNIVKDDESSDYINDNDDNFHNVDYQSDNDKKDTKLIKTESRKKKLRSKIKSFSKVNFKNCIKSKNIYTEVSNNGEVGYKCNLCVYVSASLTELQDHLEVKHEKAVRCLSCHIICNNIREHGAHHRKYHRQFICDYCGTQKKQKYTLEQHITSHHTLPQCKICNRTFKEYSILKGHMKTQHTVKPSEETYCVECDIMFDNIGLFKRHFMRVVHTKPKDRRVKCQHCNKVFSKQWTLRKHITRMHEQPASYEFQCDACAKSYVTAYRLRVHRSRVHLNIAPPKNFACELCGRKFAQRRILENHVRTHTGERPFACKLCAARFAQQAALVGHARRRHHLTLRYSNEIPS